MARVRGDGPTELTWDQELELLCGPLDDDRAFTPEGSSFASEEERRQAWLDNAEQITEYCLRVGRGQPSTTKATTGDNTRRLRSSGAVRPTNMPGERGD